MQDLKWLKSISAFHIINDEEEGKTTKLKKKHNKKKNK